MKAVWASRAVSPHGWMCVERCRWNKVCPGVSCWPVPGEATSPSALHPDSGGGEELAGSERREGDQQGLVVMVLRGPQLSPWVGKSWGGFRGWSGQEEML